MQELILKARQGNDDAVVELWENVRRMVYATCKRFAGTWSLSIEDVLQDAFILYFTALSGYAETEEYNFNTYIINSVKWGLFRKYSRIKPRTEICTLDAPMSEDDDTTHKDTLADEAAEFAETVIDEETRRTVFKTAAEYLDLYEKRQKNKNKSSHAYSDIITAHYRDGQSLSGYASEHGTTFQNIAARHRKALKLLRNCPQLQAVNNDIIGRTYRYSFRSFLQNGYSCVELATEKMNTERMKHIE